MLVQLPPGGFLVLVFERFLLAPPLFHLIHHVHDPGSNGLDENLSALPFQERKHIEVAVSFRGLRPEFTDDLYDRLDA